MEAWPWQLTLSIYSNNIEDFTLWNFQTKMGQGKNHDHDVHQTGSLNIPSKRFFVCNILTDSSLNALEMSYQKCILPLMSLRGMSMSQTSNDISRQYKNESGQLPTHCHSENTCQANHEYGVSLCIWAYYLTAQRQSTCDNMQKNHTDVVCNWLQ